MKFNIRNFMIFIGILLLVLISNVCIENLKMSKNMYVVSPKENVKKIDNKKELINLSENAEGIDFETNQKNDKNEDKNDEVVVFVSGCVKNSGVVNLISGDRLCDAIEKLGGLTDDADVNRVNLAEKVVDSNHYIIPKIGQNENLCNDKNLKADKNTKQNEDVNINSASIQQLQTLPGIGEKTAQKILDYKNNNGGFNSVDEVKNIEGIGDKKFDKIKLLISVN